MTLGAAVASALLMRLALARGRRIALSTGLLIGAAGAVGVVLAAVSGAFWLLVASGVLIGFGNAVNLQARFAATDLSATEHRGRDLSLVVWMSTIGAVAGPNLIGAGGTLAAGLGIPALSGLFVISTAGMLVGMAVIWIGLRPDPYLVLIGRQPLAGADGAVTAAPVPGGPRPGLRQGIRALWSHPGSRAGLIGIVAAHAVMVAVMSMTPVHLTGHGASITIVGLTVSLHIAGMYALAPVMGVLTDRLGGRIVAAGGMVTLLVSALLAGFSGDAHVVTVIGLILLGLGWSAATVAGSAMIVAATPVAERVAAQGASDTLMSLAGAAGGLLAGVALAAIGYLGLGAASAVVILITLAVLAWTARTNRRTP
ncbi:MFS transporter [Microbacterium aerolatum]|uniref:MFS transporter n=1 Tax=Microbacterium aerolatum TaxID=153731 RepID=UPI002001B6FB|nr:MFS transporter [Microbacterium aerolatum]MCK3768659.1 MFS transporter [Microbacterium aerolatum]